MENRLKMLHEDYMTKAGKCSGHNETPEHQRMMKSIIHEMWLINEMMDKPEHYERIGGDFAKDHCPSGVNDSPLTQKEAHEWVAKMKATGGIPWKPWTVEETKEMLTANNKKLGNLSDWCANALLNMIWSDNPVAKKETILSDAAKYVADPDVIPAANRLGLTYRYFFIH